MEDLPQELFTENSSINVEYLNNRTRETTVGVYLISLTTFRCFFFYLNLLAKMKLEE